MEKNIEDLLLELNARFYRDNAATFSATRQRLQPGVQRIAASLLTFQSRLLDLGCGNGQLAHYLAEKGFLGEYLGIDASQELLAEARQTSPFTFQAADLSAPDWDAGIDSNRFDAVLAFAVFHHLPGIRLRLEALKKIHSRLVVPGGRFYHSEWQVSNSSRLASRIHSWEEIGLNRAAVDPGDLLIDWRAGEHTGLRYVHQFDENELARLASAASFRICETFYSDGREGNLGLYQVWEAD